MGDTYLRAGVILRWNLGVSAKAFKIQVEGYAGDDETRPGSYNYGVYGGGLLRVLGDGKRMFKANLFAPETACADTLDGYNYGSFSDLYSASQSTDLMVEGPAESSFWYAHWKSEWMPRPIDPMGKLFIVPVEIIER